MKSRLVRSMAYGLAATMLVASPVYADDLAAGNSSEEITELTEEEQAAYYDGLNTVLLVATETQEEMDEKYSTDKLAEYAYLFLIDEENDIWDAVCINGDTVGELKLWDDSEEVETADQLISTAYAYGDAGSDSATNIKETVSALLKDMPIDHYVVADKADFGEITAKLGGIWMPSKNTMDLQSEVQNGTAVKMQGAELQTRIDSVSDGSAAAENDEYMLMISYMKGLYLQIAELRGAKSEEEFDNIVMPMAEYMESDCLPDELKEFFITLTELSEKEVHVLEGEYQEVDGQLQYLVEEDTITTLLHDIALKNVNNKAE